MQYFRQLIEKEYARLKVTEQSLVNLALRTSQQGIRIGIDAVDLLGQIGQSREGLAVARHDLTRRGEVDDETIAQVAHRIFAGYQQRRKVAIAAVPAIKALGSRLADWGATVSCVVHHQRSIFDPRVYELWVEHGVGRGDVVVFYLQNIGDTAHSLDEIVRLVGQPLPEKEIRYIEEPIELGLVKGFHLRPAALTQRKLDEYELGVRVRSAAGEEADGKSLMQMVGLHVAYGAALTFRFEEPRTPAQAAGLEAIRAYLRALLSGNLGQFA